LYRPLQIIVSAILLSRPAMPVAEATRYARVVQDEARNHDYDPLTAVAIVHFESRWRPGIVSPDGEDFGLGQIRARWYGACRHDADPVHAPSPGCLAVKGALLSGEYNLRRMTAIILANRELCREKVGRADLPRWLAGYEGFNVPREDRWCAPGAKTWQVVEYRKQLIAQFVPRPAPSKGHGKSNVRRAEKAKGSDATRRR
jgi:hypothetical protein